MWCELDDESDLINNQRRELLRNNEGFVDRVREKMLEKRKELIEQQNKLEKAAHKPVVVVKKEED